jgi:hypothetical protein
MEVEGCRTSMMLLFTVSENAPCRVGLWNSTSVSFNLLHWNNDSKLQSFVLPNGCEVCQIIYSACKEMPDARITSVPRGMVKNGADDQTLLILIQGTDKTESRLPSINTKRSIMLAESAYLILSRSPSLAKISYV